MKKLELNKETVSRMDKTEMAGVNGGIEVCVHSCANGSRRGKRCCNGKPVVLDISIML